MNLNLKDKECNELPKKYQNLHKGLLSNAKLVKEVLDKNWIGQQFNCRQEWSKIKADLFGTRTFNCLRFVHFYTLTSRQIRMK